MTPASLNWPRIAADLDQEGYAMLPALLTPRQTAALRTHARERPRDWQTADTLPAPFPACLRAFSAHLAPIADQWNARMERAPLAPATPGHVAFSRLVAGQYAPLCQHLHGAPPFPLQLVILLSSPGTDFTGGEFVMTEQRPRMQSRPMVLPLTAGDAALIAVARRPMQGARGDYQVNASHAISRVRSGERLGMECVFHNPIGTATFWS